jgi:hypothetical protein
VSLGRRGLLARPVPKDNLGLAANLNHQEPRVTQALRVHQVQKAIRDPKAQQVSWSLRLLFPTPTPRVTATPEPTAPPRATPESLANTTQANLWVILSNDGDRRPEYLVVKVDLDFDLEEFEMEVFVDGVEYCAPNRMYADEGAYKMGCESRQQVQHVSVERVSAQTRSSGDLRCQRNVASTARKSVFACAWR